MKILLVLIALFTHSLWAKEYKINGSWRTMTVEDGDTFSCTDKNCQVKPWLKMKSSNVTASSGGKNPTSAWCSTKGGSVILGVDRNGNQQSFCLAPDGSYGIIRIQR